MVTCYTVSSRQLISLLAITALAVHLVPTRPDGSLKQHLCSGVASSSAGVDITKLSVGLISPVPLCPTKGTEVILNLWNLELCYISPTVTAFLLAGPKEGFGLPSQWEAIWPSSPQLKQYQGRGLAGLLGWGLVPLFILGENVLADLDGALGSLDSSHFLDCFIEAIWFCSSTTYRFNSSTLSHFSADNAALIEWRFETTRLGGPEECLAVPKCSFALLL